MKRIGVISMIIAAVAVSTTVILPPLGRGQAPEAEKGKAISAAKAQNIAVGFELNAGAFAVFDRRGRLLSKVGSRAVYDREMALSPDGKRLAVVKQDLEKESRDIWIIDLATGAGTKITSSEALERSVSPVWSPDGSRLAYAALRAGNWGFYRKASDGQGAEELLYQSPGTPRLADWSMDGRFLSFFSATPFGGADLSGGVVSILPLDRSERKPIEVFRTQEQLSGGFLSPDDRFVAYTSNDSGRNEVYVRSREAARAVGPWRIGVSSRGFSGAVWRRDGKELYYVVPDQGVMAVEVNTSTGFSFGKPKRLFRPPAGRFTGFSISRDGERIAMFEPPPQLRQITVFDRHGKVVKTVGAPGFYTDPGLSPDGSRIAVERSDPKTGNEDIWTFEVATGKRYAVTNDTWPDSYTVWSPDGTQVAYVSDRDQYSTIFRKGWRGTGEEELLFRYTPGASPELNDWSADGKFLIFATGALSLVRLHGNEKALDRKAIEWLREEYDAYGGRFSPDMRHVAYVSNENDAEVFEVYVRPFDASKPGAPGPGSPVRVSKNGSQGMINWRQDGKEMYYLTRDWEVVAVEVSTSPAFQTGTPKVLFKLPGPLPGDSWDRWKNVSPAGDRFVFAMPVR